MPVNIVLIDDQPVVYRGLAAALQPYRIRLAPANLPVGTTRIGPPHPELIIMESRIGPDDGLQLLEQMQAGGESCPPMLVYSENDNPTFVARSVALGASDYLLKSRPMADVVASIRGALAGRAPAVDSLFGQMKLFLQETPVPRERLPDMTGREYQVLRHLGMGLSNREIGKSLGISIETVKEHVQNILRKLNARDRTHAAVRAIRTGIA